MGCNLLTILLTYLLLDQINMYYQLAFELQCISIFGMDASLQQFHIQLLLTYFGAVNSPSLSRFIFYIFIGMKQSQVITVHNCFLFDALRFS